MNGMKVFERVVRLGSYTKAARSLGISKATASSRVVALEARLGVQLLHRTTRVVKPTDLGVAFAARCTQILADVEEAELALAAARPTPHGVLRLTCPRLFGTAFLSPVIAAYASAHPGVAVELKLTERTVDLMEEGFDLAIRLGPLPDSTLIAKRLGAAEMGIYGTPQLAEAVTDVAKSPWVMVGTQRKRRIPVGKKRVTVEGRVAVDSLEMAAQLACEGLGVAMLPRFVAAPGLASGELVPALPELAMPPIPIHAVCPPGRRLSARVRAFFELLEPWKDAPPWG